MLTFINAIKQFLLHSRVRMDWLCDGDKNDHHNVYPTSPQYVEEEVSETSINTFIHSHKNLLTIIFFAKLVFLNYSNNNLVMRGQFCGEV